MRLLEWQVVGKEDGMLPRKSTRSSGKPCSERRNCLSQLWSAELILNMVKTLMTAFLTVLVLFHLFFAEKFPNNLNLTKLKLAIEVCRHCCLLFSSPALRPLIYSPVSIAKCLTLFNCLILCQQVYFHLFHSISWLDISFRFFS